MPAWSRVVVVVVLAGSGCSVEPVDDHAVVAQPVIGGELTEVGDFPALALIVVGGINLCTGALIDPSWVITAEHCVNYPPAGLTPGNDLARRTTIAFDRLHRDDTDGVEVRGRAMVVHPDWDHDVLHGNDLALIQLDRPITDREPMPINLDPDRPLADAAITFVGFGRTDPDDAASGGTAYTLPARTSVPCATLGDELPLGDDQLLCFDQRDGHGVCRGDSGGPVIADLDGVPTLVGVVSLVFDPAGASCNAYAGATRSDAFAGFITEALEGGDDDGGCSAGRGGVGSAPLLLVGLLGLRRRRRATGSVRAAG